MGVLVQVLVDWVHTFEQTQDSSRRRTSFFLLKKIEGCKRTVQ